MGTSDLTLRTANDVNGSLNGSCRPAALALASGRVAVDCAGEASIIAFDGTRLVSIQALEVLGMSADARGIVTVDFEGRVSYLTIDGEVRDLATALSPFGDRGQLAAPFAAYAP